MGDGRATTPAPADIRGPGAWHATSRLRCLPCHAAANAVWQPLPLPPPQQQRQQPGRACVQRSGRTNRHGGCDAHARVVYTGGVMPCPPLCCYVGCQQWWYVPHVRDVAAGQTRRGSVKPPAKHAGAVQSPWSRSIWRLGLAAPCSCCGLCCWFAVYRLESRGRSVAHPAGLPWYAFTGGYAEGVVLWVWWAPGDSTVTGVKLALT